jgi:uncharacterized delta-60 repeat protein
MALQSDGKILVSGTGMNNSVSVLIRYNHNGTLDSTFDYDGIVTTVIGSHSLKQLICIQPDGKIVTAGRCVGASELIALARYNTNGSLDTTFNSNGIVTTSIGSINDGAESISLQPDGKILVGGYSFNGTNTNFAVLRYNTNGSLDTTFNADGIITTAIGTNSSVYSISLQSDGKIVAGGESQIGTGAIINFAIARYNTNGSLDSTFGTTGIIVTSIGNYNDYGRALTIQSNGKILLVGGTTLTNGSTYQSALVRYNINGILDSTFDNDGIVTTFFSTGNYSDGNAIILQSDGKIVVGGIAGYDFVLARYNNDIPIEVNEICKEVPKVRIYPNPFIISTNLNIETPLKNAKLSIYNNFGQLVKKIENLYGTDITINRDNLLNGLYYFQLTEENEVISKNKFVIAD